MKSDRDSRNLYLFLFELLLDRFRKGSFDISCMLSSDRFNQYDPTFIFSNRVVYYAFLRNDLIFFYYRSSLLFATQSDVAPKAINADFWAAVRPLTSVIFIPS